MVSSAIFAVFTVFLAIVFTIFSPPAGARAQDVQPGIMANGDLAVTGFSGTKELGGETFIDTEGTSLKVFDVSGRGKARAQVVNAPVKFEAFARDIGQVFGVALDNAMPPNIYVAATSAHGLQIVVADQNGDGIPERVTTGQPGATFMEGQFGANMGGGPGTVWRIDGTTGEITLFADIKLAGMHNSGPGLGNIAFDPSHFQFFVSDLDTGVIHSLDLSGNDLGTFDHGVQGRSATGLAPVLMNPTDRMDITSPTFDSGNSNTWGLADERRRVWGLAYFSGRLYYAVADRPQIWSVGINTDGGFVGDARVEIQSVPGGFPVSDILFTPRGRMVLAQRGGILGAHDYTQYHTPKENRVLRYSRDETGNWVQEPEEYAIGFPVDHKYASGGVGLSCDGTLWSTGDALRNNPELADRLTPGGPLVVHGLQGNKLSLVRPFNVPPWSSWFVDYDGQFADPEKAGHVGDVEVYRHCPGGRAESFPGWYPIPEWYPPEGWVPPIWWPRTPDLDLEKIAGDCVADIVPGTYLCTYTIVVTNMGAADFVGFIHVVDNPPVTGEYLPPPGGSIPWNCAQPGGAGTPIACDSTFVETLLPGEAETLEITIRVTPAHRDERILNCAILDEHHHGDDPGTNPWPEDPHGNNEDCDEADLPRPDLEIEKTFIDCTFFAGSWRCVFVMGITNVGPVPYHGPLHFVENIPPGTIFGGIFFYPTTTPGWACIGGPPVECTLPDPPGVTLNPGEVELIAIGIIVPLGQISVMENCVNLGDPTHADDAAAPGVNEACEPFEVPQPVLHECPEGWTEVPPGGAPPGDWEVVALDGINPDGTGWGIMCMRPLSLLRSPIVQGPSCHTGESRYESRNQVPQSWTSRRVSRGGRTVYCAKPPVVIPDPLPTCNRGETTHQSAGQIPKGWTWRKVTAGKRTVYCAKPPVVIPDPLPTCNRAETTYQSAGQIPKGWTWRKVTVGKRTVYCAKRSIVPPRPQCIGGTPILLKTLPPRWLCKCPQGKQLVGNRCVSKPVLCPRGWRKVKGKCKPPVVTPTPSRPVLCPKGWRKVKGKCKPPVAQNRPTRPNLCPKGWRKVKGKCKPPLAQNRPPKPNLCPKGWRRTGKGCLRPTRPRPTGCPQGHYFSPATRRCVLFQ